VPTAPRPTTCRLRRARQRADCAAPDNAPTAPRPTTCRLRRARQRADCAAPDNVPTAPRPITREVLSRHHVILRLSKDGPAIHPGLTASNRARVPRIPSASLPKRAYTLEGERVKMDRWVLFRAGFCATGLALATTACGGGGGGSQPPTGTSPVATPSSSPSTAPSSGASPLASPSPSGSSATASGTVVDFAANTPLAGVNVSLAAYTPGAPATSVATTNSAGVFTFSASPGTYLLIIGSNSPTDTTTTLHTKITLAAGTNALAFVVPPSEPNVTYTAAQSSGNFRLTALSGNQLSCFTGANSGRTANALLPLIPDEALTEFAAALSQEAAGQNTDTPNPLFSNGLVPSYGILDIAAATTSTGFFPCSSWTGPSYSYVGGNPPYAAAMSSSSIWYGAQQVNSLANIPYGAQAWALDPR